MNNELIVQKVLRNMNCIRAFIDSSKNDIRRHLSSDELEEAAREYKRLRTLEGILEMLEESFETEEENLN